MKLASLIALLGKFAGKMQQLCGFQPRKSRIGFSWIFVLRLERKLPEIQVMNLNSLIPPVFFSHTKKKCHKIARCLLQTYLHSLPNTIWIRNGEAQVRLKWAAMISMPGTLFKAEKLMKLR